MLLLLVLSSFFDVCCVLYTRTNSLVLYLPTTQLLVFVTTDVIYYISSQCTIYLSTDNFVYNSAYKQTLNAYCMAYTRTLAAHFRCSLIFLLCPMNVDHCFRCLSKHYVSSETMSFFFHNIY